MALREARGLFREHKQAFSPRGPGDDAGRLMRKIVEQDATPTEVATGLFGSMPRFGETGLSVRFATRLREALGDDSPVLDAVQQGLIARAIDGNGAGDVGRRLDTLLRGNGREAANAIFTQEQRRGLGAFRAALHQAEQAHHALPSWISDLSRSGFDPNAVATSLFGSGVPGSRVGSANFARGLKGFLGEGSEEWSGMRQAAIQNLTQPSGRTLTATQKADRVADFVSGKGAALAREMFGGEELARLTRYAAALRATVLPSGIGSLTAEQGRTIAANLLNGLLGAIAFKSGLPTAAAAPFTVKAGQRIVIGGPGAFGASRSFGGGAPRVVPDTPEHFQRLGQGAGRAAGLLSDDRVPSGR
jgi:hypothetical protein